MVKKYRVAVIGATGRGDYGHGIDTVWLQLDNVDIVAVADQDEAGRAKRLLAKRFAGAALKESKTRNRAVAFLQRRGYSSKVIFDLLGYSIEED